MLSLTLTLTSLRPAFRRPTLPLLVLAGALLVAGCADHRGVGIKRESGVLTTQLPAAVRKACINAERTVTRVRFACPSLVPHGRAQVQVQYARRDFYEFSFVSRSLERRTGGRLIHLGHWILQGGDPKAVSAELATNLPRGLPKPVGRIREKGIEAKILRIKNYQNVHAGHVVLVWMLAGASYDVSIHGFENETVAVRMARTLIDDLSKGHGHQ